MAWIPPPRGPESYAKLTEGLARPKNLVRLGALWLHDVQEGRAKTRSVYETDNRVTFVLRGVLDMARLGFRTAFEESIRKMKAACDEAGVDFGVDPTNVDLSETAIRMLAMRAREEIAERKELAPGRAVALTGRVDVAEREALDVALLATLSLADSPQRFMEEYLFRVPVRDIVDLDGWPEMTGSPFLSPGLQMTDEGVSMSSPGLGKAGVSRHGALLLDKVAESIIEQGPADNADAFSKVGGLSLLGLRAVATFRGKDAERAGLRAPFLLSVQGRPAKLAALPSEAAAGHWIGQIDDRVIEPVRLAIEAFEFQGGSLASADIADRLKLLWLRAWFTELIEDGAAPVEPPRIGQVPVRVLRGWYRGGIRRVSCINWELGEPASRVDLIKTATSKVAGFLSWERRPASDSFVGTAPPTWMMKTPATTPPTYSSNDVFGGQLTLLHPPEQPLGGSLYAMLWVAPEVNE